MRAALLALGLLAPAIVPAQQSVYRCGQTYQQSPCERGGKAVEVDDSRSDAQRKAAAAVGSAEARLGKSLERERQAREKAAPPTAAVGIGAPLAAASAPGKAKKRHAKGNAKQADPGRDDFVAIEPRTRRDKGAKR